MLYEGKVENRSKVPEEQRKRVLIVDDETAIRETFAMLCSHYGHDADTAADGVEGLAMYKKGGYDLILTDNNMPVMGGWEMMEEIKQNGNGVPVVLLSGRPIDPGEAKAQGFIHYEPKPVMMSRVHELIEQYAKKD